MDKQNLMPQVAQPVNRTTSGQLPDVLAELSEEALQLHDSAGDSGDSAAVSAAREGNDRNICSYDGDDAE